MSESSENGVPASSGETGESSEQREERPECGVVMPISGIGGLGSGHWEEVRDILFEPIRKAGFRPSLVSESDEVTIIHRSIVQNLYENEIVVCDVSAKNPNVMFELGLRLAFDKPTVIVKDSETSYSFDTSPIEHLEYPRSLRYQGILDFKGELKDKLTSTANTAAEDKQYSPFLRHFGQYQVSGLSQEEVTEFEYLRGEIDEVKTLLSKVSYWGRQRRAATPPKILSSSLSNLSEKLYGAVKDLIEMGELDKKGLMSSDPGELSYATNLAFLFVDSDTQNQMIDHGIVDKNGIATSKGKTMLRMSCALRGLP